MSKRARDASAGRGGAGRGCGAERDAREEMRVERVEAVRVAREERERADGRVRVLEGTLRDGEIG